MNHSQRLAFIALTVAKLGNPSKMAAVMHATEHDIREEASLVNVSDRGELSANDDFDSVPASREILLASGINPVSALEAGEESDIDAQDL